MIPPSIYVFVTLAFIILFCGTLYEPMPGSQPSSAYETVAHADKKALRDQTPIKARCSPKDTQSKPGSHTGLDAELKNIAITEKLINLDFVLTNHSNDPIVLAHRVNSWGASQWKFILTDSEGTQWKLANQQSDWWGNVFSTFEIPPSGSYVMHSRLIRNATQFSDGEVMIFAEKSAYWGQLWEDSLPASSSGDGTEIESWKYPIKVYGRFEAKIHTMQTVSTNWAGSVTSHEIICD